MKTSIVKAGPLALLMAAGGALAEPPKAISVKGMPETQFRQLRDDQVIEIGNRTLTVAGLRTESAARLRETKAKFEPRKAQFRSDSVAELARLRRNLETEHQKRLVSSKQLVTAELAKAPREDGGAGDAVSIRRALDAKASALKLREGSARTAAEWLAIEEEAKALLAQAR